MQLNIDSIDLDSVKTAKTIKEALSIVKEADYNAVRNKAKRLKDGGQVILTVNEVNAVEAQVRGDHGEYEVSILRQNPADNRITQWSCTCPWGRYAFNRSRKWKYLEGRMCSHSMATMYASWSAPLTSAPQQTLFNQQLPPTPIPNYEVVPNEQQPEQLPTPQTEQPLQLSFPGLEQNNLPTPGIGGFKTTKWKKI